MSHRTVSWTRIDRAGRDSRPTIPAGLLSATARIDMTVRTTRRPLYAAGKFDRADASGDPVAHRAARRRLRQVFRRPGAVACPIAVEAVSRA